MVDIPEMYTLPVAPLDFSSKQIRVTPMGGVPVSIKRVHISRGVYCVYLPKECIPQVGECAMLYREQYSGKNKVAKLIAFLDSKIYPDDFFGPSCIDPSNRRIFVSHIPRDSVKAAFEILRQLSDGKLDIYNF